MLTQINLKTNMRAYLEEQEEHFHQQHLRFSYSRDKNFNYIFFLRFPGCKRKLFVKYTFIKQT